MKNPHDCVPKGTVPLMEFRPVFAPLMGACHDRHRHKNTHEISHDCGMFYCRLIGFRVPPEMVNEFKY